MDQTKAAPVLSRVKSWQLIGLGISGWVALYSAAVISWGASSLIVGNAQGGCFAVTMTLAGIEARRFRQSGSTPVNSLQWVNSVTTEQLNQTLARTLKSQEIRVETPHKTEVNLGFSVRAIVAGRSLVFETERWKEAVIDLEHAKTTDENRQKILADQAIIVGAGTPDKAARGFVVTHPAIKFLVGQELKDLLFADQPADNPSAKKI